MLSSGCIPTYVYDANAYEFLAEAYLAKDNKPAAAQVLEAYVKAGGRRPAVLENLAQIQEESGRPRRRGGHVGADQLHRSRLRRGPAPATWQPCGSRRKTMQGRFVNTARSWRFIRSMRPPRSSISPRPISPRDNATRPRTPCWPRSRRRPTTDPRKSYCCRSRVPTVEAGQATQPEVQQAA